MRVNDSEQQRKLKHKEMARRNAIARACTRIDMIHISASGATTAREMWEKLAMIRNPNSKSYRGRALTCSPSHGEQNLRNLQNGPHLNFLLY